MGKSSEATIAIAAMTIGRDTGNDLSCGTGTNSF